MMFSVLISANRILLIGDSITYGKGNPPGFRDNLYDLLKIRGYPFDRINSDEEIDINTLISAEQCMFIGSLLPCLRDQKDGDNQND